MRKTKFLAIVLAFLILATVLMSSNVFAREYTATQINDPDSLTSLTITRDVNNVTNPVTNNFDYTIELNSKPATATITGLPNLSSTAETSNAVTITDLVCFNAETPDSSKTATQTGTLNLLNINGTNVTFDEVGDYLFTITESASDDATTYPVDETNSYEICISVRNELDATTNYPTGRLVVKLEYVKDLTEGNTLNDETGKLDIYPTDPEADPEPLAFESESVHTYIELTKEVTGNMARRDEYFPFEIELTHTNVKPGDEISVSNKAANGEYYDAGEQYDTVVVDSNNKITVYAKHGETIVIGKTSDGSYQLPLGTQYTITESDYSATEPYTTKIDGTDDADKAITKTTVAEGAETFNTANKTTYVNNRVADPITGIFFNIMPYVLLVAVAIFGIVLIKKSSKKEE